jgi:hypothetical protein
MFELLDALMPLVSSAPSDSDDDLQVEADADVARSLPPPPMIPQTPAPPTAAAAAAAEPHAAARLSNAAARPSDVNIGDLLAKITENEAACWMVVKDSLDHGPFSGRELVHLIFAGEVQVEHGLLNLDTGERRSVGENPEL